LRQSSKKNIIFDIQAAPYLWCEVILATFFGTVIDCSDLGGFFALYA
jgi:hypothetical protein